MGMVMRRSAGAQLPSSRITAALILVIGILVSQTAAKPQSGNDQRDGIRGDDSSAEGHGIFLQNTTASFPATGSRNRRHSMISFQGEYKLTPGVGLHIIYKHARTWDQARAICREEGGDLAVINSQAESQALAELMAKSHPHHHSYNPDFVIIGFNDRDEGGEHVTVDGSSLEDAGFSEWAREEPTHRRHIKNCGSIDADGRLREIYCERAYAFACERPMLDQVVPTGPTGPQCIPGGKCDAGIPGPAGSPGQKGEPGERGTQGAAGVDGSKGETGPLGSPGVKGDRGDQGPTGQPGPPGPPGSNGAAGVDGSKGETGPLGSPGVKGDRGDQGPTGPPGPPGPPGSNGAQGSKGIQGEAGYCSCPAGLKGDKGDPGTAEVPCIPGQHGGSGEEREAEDEGSGEDTSRRPPRRTGPNGVHGPQGPKGETGSPGPRGEPGLGYDAACLAFLSNLQCSQGVGLIDGVPAPTFIGNINFAEECREFITKAYKQISEASSPSLPQPNGQKESPAKTCRHLFVAYPDKPSGEYWIDPNEGDVSDAFLAHCDARGGTTCVTPKSSRTLTMSHSGEEREIWLSVIDDEFRITYNAATNQINALQALSGHGEQNVTYHCRRSVAYLDTKTKSYERGLKFLAWNDVELVPSGSQHFNYDVISDGCKDRLDEWKETVITYRTNQPARLPVLDVGLRDVGKPDQQFSVEIGRVCFK